MTETQTASAVAAGGVPTDAASLAEAFLQVLAGALELERAALLIDDAGTGRYLPVATLGEVHVKPVAPGSLPGDGPWSDVLPVTASGRQAGLLLLAKRNGDPLSEPDHALALHLAEGAGRIIEHGRLTADLARARELLARADRMSVVGTLAAGVAHEIRNPLVSVRTFIQLLPERYHDEEFRVGFRDLALREIERICNLITDLLGFSRQGPEGWEAVDLNDVVGQTVRLLDSQARHERVVIAQAYDGELPPIVADEAQVRQVVMNLMVNAIEACGGPGSVFVGTRRETDGERTWSVIVIGDSGPGIPPALRAQIFDPFFTTKTGGSGLGLYIAHQIVTEHGGQIQTGQREGGGALFSVSFPVPAERRDVDVG